jgi:hypothetical protein
VGIIPAGQFFRARLFAVALVLSRSISAFGPETRSQSPGKAPTPSSSAVLISIANVCVMPTGSVVSVQDDSRIWFMSYRVSGSTNSPTRARIRSPREDLDINGESFSAIRDDLPIPVSSRHLQPIGARAAIRRYKRQPIPPLQGLSKPCDAAFQCDI